MTGVLPYVPSEALHLLPRDVQRFEPRVALDGGPGGLGLIGRALAAGPRWLKRGGWLLLEVGTDQVDEVSMAFAASGFGDVAVIEDDDGDGRGVVGRLE
jgi:release factor glutamine methyltransferase